MYTIDVEENFSAAHNLRGYKGKCEELHGHNWNVRAEIFGSKLDKLGMVVDFRFVKKKLNEILEELDHKYLNQIPYFKKINPTSECIAQYIYNSLKVKIPQLKSITIWESDNCSATYSDD